MIMCPSSRRTITSSGQSPRCSYPHASGKALLGTRSGTKRCAWARPASRTGLRRRCARNAPRPSPARSRAVAARLSRPPPGAPSDRRDPDVVNEAAGRARRPEEHDPLLVAALALRLCIRQRDHDRLHRGRGCRARRSTRRWEWFSSGFPVEMSGAFTRTILPCAGPRPP